MTYSASRLLFLLVVSTGCLIASALVPGSHAADAKEGAALFADKGCAHCHGPSGFGGSDSGPDLSHVRQELKAPEIAQQIHDGGNNMPPFGDALSEDEIASLVSYLRSRRKPPPGFHPQTRSNPAPTQETKPDPD